MSIDEGRRDWSVLLIGGSSGVGKTTVARKIRRRAYSRQSESERQTRRPCVDRRPVAPWATASEHIVRFNHHRHDP